MLAPLDASCAVVLAQQLRGPAKKLAGRLHAMGLSTAEIIAAVDAELGVRLTPADVRAAVSARKPSLVALNFHESGRFGVAAPDAHDALGRAPRGVGFKRGLSGLSGLLAAAGHGAADGAAVSVADTIASVGTPALLTDCAPRGCRAPVAGEGAATLFCNAPADHGSSYCAPCRAKLNAGTADEARRKFLSAPDAAFSGAPDARSASASPSARASARPKAKRLTGSRWSGF
jgi:hypothetical protein